MEALLAVLFRHGMREQSVWLVCDLLVSAGPSLRRQHCLQEQTQLRLLNACGVLWLIRQTRSHLKPPKSLRTQTVLRSPSPTFPRSADVPEEPGTGSQRRSCKCPRTLGPFGLSTSSWSPGLWPYCPLSSADKGNCWLVGYANVYLYKRMSNDFMNLLYQFQFLAACVRVPFDSHLQNLALFTLYNFCPLQICPKN